MVVDHICNSASVSNTTALKHRRRILSCLPVAEAVGLSCLARIILSTSRSIVFRPFHPIMRLAPDKANIERYERPDQIMYALICGEFEIGW